METLRGEVIVVSLLVRNQELAVYGRCEHPDFGMLAEPRFTVQPPYTIQDRGFALYKYGFRADEHFRFFVRKLPNGRRLLEIRLHYTHPGFCPQEFPLGQLDAIHPEVAEQWCNKANDVLRSLGR